MFYPILNQRAQEDSSPRWLSKLAKELVSENMDEFFCRSTTAQLVSDLGRIQLLFLVEIAEGRFISLWVICIGHSSVTRSEFPPELSRGL